MLLIDGYYFSKGWRSSDATKGCTLCIEKLVPLLEEGILSENGTKLLYKFWMDSTPEPVVAKHIDNIKTLQRLGYQCPIHRYKKMSRGNVVCPKDGHVFKMDFSVQAGVDVGLSVLAMKFAASRQNDPISDVILVAGDGDFKPLLMALQEWDKRVWLLSYSNSYSPELRSVVGSRFQFIDGLAQRLSVLKPAMVETRNADAALIVAPMPDSTAQPAPTVARHAQTASGRGAFCASGTVLPGDWQCTRCRGNNFASRSACFLCGDPRSSTSQSIDGTTLAKRDVGRALTLDTLKSEASRVSHGKASSIYITNPPTFSPRRLQDSGSWVCAGCSSENYSIRTRCRNCDRVKSFGATGITASK